MDQVKLVSTFLAIELLHVSAPRMLGSEELATPTPDLTKAPAGAASYSLGEEEAEPNQLKKDMINKKKK